MKIKEIKSKLKELDNMELPDKEFILGEALNERDSVTEEVQFPTLRRRTRFIPAAAVGLILLGTAAFLISRTTVTQAKNYRDAVEFFEKYALSSEGLSKYEITEVYFDIIKGTFSLEKTEQVIHQTALAYDIMQNTPEPDEVEELWRQILNRRYDIMNYIVTSFEITYQNNPDIMKSCFKKYENGKLAWEKEFDFEIRNYKTYGDYIVVGGDTPQWDDAKNTEIRETYIAVINRGGNILWERRLENGSDCEKYHRLIADENGISVFSSIEKKLQITSFDYEGEVVDHAENAELLKFDSNTYGWIWNVTRAQEGFYVQLRTSGVIGLPNYNDCVIKLNGEGQVLETFNYVSDGIRYNIEDLLEIDGKLYLSGYSYASSKEEGLMENMFNILEELGLFSIGADNNEELNKRTREVLSGVLFVCDSESGEIKELFRINGSVGGGLGVNDEENLIWDVGNAGKVSYDEMASHNPIRVLCQVYRYTFDSTGNLIYYNKTDNVTVFDI